MGQVVEVDVSEIVGGLVVVGSESVAGDGLGDDAAAGKVEIVRALEEVLGGMGIGGRAALRVWREWDRDWCVPIR